MVRKDFYSQISFQWASCKATPLRAGFTLIEMLVVITIVGIIAGIAVSSYGTFRRQAKLDIAVDSLISAFKEQIGKTKSGQYSEASSACFGLHIQKNTPVVQYFVTPYISAQGEKVDMCDMSAFSFSPYDFPEELELQSILFNETSVDSLDIFSKPPLGKVVARSDLNTDPVVPMIVVTIGLQNSDQKRTLEFDGLTGNIRRVPNSSS